MNQTVVILDFGGQYNQLIARRVRECGVYCEVLPYHTPVEKISKKEPIGIIFTGGPNSVYLEDAPRCSKEVFELGIPVLGICYGIQVMAHTLGGHVTSPDSREYGKTETKYDTACPLFASAGDYLDEPHRLRGPNAGGIFCNSVYGFLSHSGHAEPREKALWPPVPSRGVAYPERNPNAS